MPDASARYALPFLQAGQAQKEITHNAAIDRIDALLQLAVASRAVSAPPASPVVGTSWIVPADATGDWSGHADHIATAGDGGWTFTLPRDGCIAWIADETVFGVHFASAWHADGWPVAGLRIGERVILSATAPAITAPTGGGVVDSEARTAISAVLSALRLQGLIAT
jgi:hypothetical protein